MYYQNKTKHQKIIDMKKFFVIKKSAGYAVKSFREEISAINYAAQCCKANRNDNYMVCIYQGGVFVEI